MDKNDLSNYQMARDRVRKNNRLPFRYAQTDLIADAFQIGDVIEPNVPLNYKQVCKSKNKVEWLKTMQDEMNSLHKNETWSLVNRFVNQKVIGCK